MHLSPHSLSLSLSEVHVTHWSQVDGIRKTSTIQHIFQTDIKKFQNFLPWNPNSEIFTFNQKSL